MRVRRSVGCQILVFLVALSACEQSLDLPPIRMETEHLLIGTEFDDDVCAGSLAELDRHVEFVEAQLGIELEDQLEFYWFVDDASSACDGTANCTLSAPTRVLTNWSSARHELVHGVALQLGGHDHFLAEGLAVGFDGNRTEFGDQSPYLSVGYLNEHVDRPSAGHFVRWLHATKGPGVLRDLVRETEADAGPGATRQAFEQVLGEQLADTEIRYYGEAPERYPITTFCEHPELAWSDGVDTSIELDCAAEHTRGVGELTRSFRVGVANAGWFTVATDVPATLEISACNSVEVPFMTDLPTPPTPPVGEDFGGREPVVPHPLDGQQNHSVRLEATSYRIDVTTVAAQTAQVGLRIVPKVGPHPP